MAGSGETPQVESTVGQPGIANDFEKELAEMRATGGALRRLWGAEKKIEAEGDQPAVAA